MGIVNAVIGALRVNLGIDTAEFENGVKRTQDSLKGTFAGFTVDLGEVAKQIGDALKEIPDAIGSVIDRANDLGHLSEKIGVPVEALSQLQFAAQSVDVSFDGISAGLKRLSQDMVGGAHQTAIAATALKDLGVSTRTASGALRPTQDVFLDVAQKLSSLKDGAGKTALELAIFGKSGADLAPLLDKGAAGIADLMKQSDLLGLTLTGTTAEEADAFKTNMALVGQAAQGIVTRLTEALLPALLTISNGLARASQWVAQMTSGLSGLAPYIPEIAAEFAALVAPSILVGLGELVTLIGTGMVAAVDALTAAMAANPVGLIVVGIGLAVAAVIHFRDQIKSALGVDVIGVLRQTGNFIIGSFVGALDEVVDVWQALPGALGDILTQAAQAVIDGTIYMVRQMVVEINKGVGQANILLGELHLPTLDQIDLPGYVKLLNANAGAAADLSKKIGSDLNTAFSTDYIGNFASGFIGLSSSVSGAGTALTSFNGALDSTKPHMQKVKSAAQTLADAISGSLSSGFNTMSDDLKQGLGFVQAFGDGLQSMLDDFIGKIASSAFQNAADQLANLLVPGGNAGANQAGGSSGGLIGAIGTAFSNLFHFANGGSGVVGGSGGTDSQLFTAMVTPGEPYAFGQDALDGIAPQQASAIVTNNFNLSFGSVSGDPKDMVKQLKKVLPGVILDARRRGAIV
jgi:hypothetical protein